MISSKVLFVKNSKHNFYFLELVDDNISDDIACTKIIFNRHGFNAWYGWKNKCQGSLAAYQVNECF